MSHPATIQTPADDVVAACAVVAAANDVGVIVYTGDCMPAIQDLLKMKGTVDIFPEYLSCLDLQLFMMCIWTSYGTP